MKHRSTLIFVAVILSILNGIFILPGCDENMSLTGINSKSPGIVRIYITSDETDDFIVVAGDTVWVGEGVNDSLSLKIGQARAFRDSSQAVLFNTLQDYQEFNFVYNIIKLENNKYKPYKIFESNLPAATYDSLLISINSDWLQIGYYQFTISLPENENPLMTFKQSFKINAGRVTGIFLVLRPFESMVRVKDTYQFFRDIIIAQIKEL